MAEFPSRAALWREPLVHFLVLGFLIFALDRWAPWRGSGEGRIEISAARQASLAQNFQRTWQRPPTATELGGLVEEAIRDEVLTREAVRLGLDRDDTVIRRRLRQKLELIQEDAGARVEASDEALRTWRAAHPEAFRGEPRFAFAQVFFDPAKRGTQIDAQAARVRTQLNAAPAQAAAAAARMGDALFVLQAEYPLTGARAIAATFGDGFAAALAQLPPAAAGEPWQGPVKSGYGLHLVRILSQEAGADLPFETVRPFVEREWRNAERERLREAQYQALRAQYAIRVTPMAGP